MLLLRHPLATLLDDRTHCVTPRSRDVTPIPGLITAGACRRTTPECYRASLRDASQRPSCPEFDRRALGGLGTSSPRIRPGGLGTSSPRIRPGGLGTSSPRIRPGGLRYARPA